MTINAAELSEFQRSSLDFRISIAEQQRHPTFLCVNGEFLTLAQAKALREEWDMAQTKDYIIKTQGRRELQLNKQSDGTYQAKVFLRGPDKTLATLVIEEAEMKKLANYSAGLLKK